jgi:hypothetical protein
MLSVIGRTSDFNRSQTPTASIRANAKLRTLSYFALKNPGDG